MPFAPAATSRVTDRLFAVRTLFCNFYVYTDGKSSICFDTGFLPPLARTEMKRIGLDPKRISAVFLTHSDYDHAGGLGLFPQANLFLGEAEVPMLTFRKMRAPLRFNHIRRKDWHALKDGATIRIGDIEVKAIAAPGHTTGSTAYLVDGETLITGDTLSFRGDEIRPFPWLMNMDTKQECDTLRRLSGMSALKGVQRVCTGHHGVHAVSGGVKFTR